MNTENQEIDKDSVDSNPIESEPVTERVGKYVSVEKEMLDTLAKEYQALKNKNAQFEEDLVFLFNALETIWQSVKSADGLMSLVPIKKISTALIMGKSPEFSADEIQTLLLKAKSKIVKDDSLSIVFVQLIEVLNRYLPILGVDTISTEFKQILINELRRN